MLSEWLRDSGLPLQTAVHMGFKVSRAKNTSCSDTPSFQCVYLFLHNSIYLAVRNGLFYTNINGLFTTRLCNAVWKRHLCHFPRHAASHIIPLKTGCLTSYKASCVMSCQIRGGRTSVSLRQHKQTHYSACTLSVFWAGSFILRTSGLCSHFYRW